MTVKATGPGKTSSDGNKFLLFNFDVDSARLKEEHKAFLRKHVVPKLKDGADFDITGMTDRTGNEEYNRQLSAKRVSATLAFLRDEVSPSLAPSLSVFRGEGAARDIGQADGTASDDFRGVFITVRDKASPAAIKPRIDLIFRFKGDPEIGELGETEVFSNEALRLAQKYAKLPNRKLHRFGLKGFKFGADPAERRQTIMNRAKAAIKGGQLGVVVVIGSSAGGRDALLFQGELAAEKITVTYLATANVAMFPHEVRPRFLVESGRLPEPSLDPDPAIFSQLTAHNYYQTKGNSSTATAELRKRRVYTSTMGGEIHGKIMTMSNRDRSNRCLQTDAFALHKELIALVEPEIVGEVVGILDRAEELSGA